MEWRRRSTDIVISDCGRYVVERHDCFGVMYYDALLRRPRAIPTVIKELCADADTAKAACEAHAAAGA